MLAALEQSASHVLVDSEQNLGQHFVVASDIDGCVSLSSNVIHFGWATGVGAPKFLQIHSTERDVLPEHAVDLLET